MTVSETSLVGRVGKLFDMHGREIVRGDVLKVYHFTGARRKRHYMYKHALGTKALGSGLLYMQMDHLDLDGRHYLEACDGRVLPDYEIVQSADAKFEERPRLASAIRAARLKPDQ